MQLSLEPCVELTCRLHFCVLASLMTVPTMGGNSVWVPLQGTPVLMFCKASMPQQFNYITI